jgi:hypothetical protein
MRRGYIEGALVDAFFPLVRSLEKAALLYVARMRDKARVGDSQKLLRHDMSHAKRVQIQRTYLFEQPVKTSAQACVTNTHASCPQSIGNE